MTAGRWQPASLVVTAGFALSVLCGALIGSGETQVVVVVVASIGLLAVLGVLLSKLVLSWVRVGDWIVAGAFFSMPLNAMRFSESVTVGDFLILVSIPVAVLLVIRRSQVPRLPVWLMFGAVLLSLSLLVVEVFPPGGITEISLTPISGLQNRSEVETTNLVAGIRLLMALVALPVVVATIAVRWTTIRLLTNAWLAGVFVSCLAALWAPLSGSWGLLSVPDPQPLLTALPVFSDTYSGGQRAIGLSVHPTTLSLTTVMALPVVLMRMEDRQSALRYFPILTVFAVAILLSETRTGILALGFVLILSLLLNPRTRRMVVPVAGLALAVIAILVVSTSVPGVERFQGDSLSAAQSNGERLEIIGESLGYIMERPITGNGFELVRGSHNLTLQLLLAGGFLATVGYFTIVLGYLLSGWKVRLKVPAWLYGDALGLTLSLAVFLFSGLFQNDIYDRYLYIPAALILGMVMVSGRLAERNQRVRDSSRSSDQGLPTTSSNFTKVR